MPGYPVGLWHGAKGPLPPLIVSGKAEDGGKGGRVLRCNLPQRERGVTEGDSLSPIIFNVVLDAVVRHWESLLLAEREGGKSSGDEGDGTQMPGRTIRDRYDSMQWTEKGHKWMTVKAVFFYANDGVVASTDPGWI